MPSITMRTVSAGPKGSFQPGQRVNIPTDLDLETAELWVEVGVAVWAEKPTPEAATLQQPETAVLPAVRKRKGK